MRDDNMAKKDSKKEKKTSEQEEKKASEQEEKKVSEKKEKKSWQGMLFFSVNSERFYFTKIVFF